MEWTVYTWQGAGKRKSGWEPIRSSSDSWHPAQRCCGLTVNVEKRSMPCVWLSCVAQGLWELTKIFLNFLQSLASVSGIEVSALDKLLPSRWSAIPVLKRRKEAGWQQFRNCWENVRAYREGWWMRNHHIIGDWCNVGDKVIYKPDLECGYPPHLF